MNWNEERRESKRKGIRGGEKKTRWPPKRRFEKTSSSIKVEVPIRDSQKAAPTDSVSALGARKRLDTQEPSIDRGITSART